MVVPWQLALLPAIDQPADKSFLSISTQIPNV
jgi:hypothetical protein